MDRKEISRYDKVDLGCGKDKHKGCLGVDIKETGSTDLILDLSKKHWSLPSDSFEKVWCKDILEHMSKPVSFMEEVHRISKSNAEVHIRVPHFTNKNSWVDPTHKRPYSAFTFSDYFTSGGKYRYYTDATFKLKRLHIEVPASRRRPWSYIGRYIANNHTGTYEDTVLRCLFPARSIQITLKTVK